MTAAPELALGAVQTTSFRRDAQGRRRDAKVVEARRTGRRQRHLRPHGQMGVVAIIHRIIY